MKEVAIVKNANGDEIFFGETVGECQRYCDKNNITGENGEYIAVGTFNEENRYFEVEDYEEIRI